MLGFAVTLALFVALAALVLRWARIDLRKQGGPATRSAVAAWVLYVLHADSVAWAAWGHLLVVDVPARPALVIGIAIGTAGFVLFLVASIQLGTRAEFAQMRPGRLVTTGIFGRARHPQNTGWALVLTGAAVGGRSLVALTLVAVFVVFAERFVRIEDEQLELAFGDEYRDYRARTPAVPWLGAGRTRPPQTV